MTAPNLPQRSEERALSWAGAVAPDSDEYVTLGDDLRSRAIGYFVTFCRSPYSDSYVNALGAASGQRARVIYRHTASYTLEIDGKACHVPSVLVAIDPVRDAEQATAYARRGYDMGGKQVSL